MKKKVLFTLNVFKKPFWWMVFSLSISLKKFLYMQVTKFLLYFTFVKQCYRKRKKNQTNYFLTIIARNINTKSDSSRLQEIQIFCYLFPSALHNIFFRALDRFIANTQRPGGADARPILPFFLKCHQLCHKCIKTRGTLKFLLKLNRTLL